jgi:hypothetical protein
MGRPNISDKTRFGLDMVVKIKISNFAKIELLSAGHPARIAVTAD